MTRFILTQKQKHLLMKVKLTMYLDLCLPIESAWIIHLVKDHNINVSKYNPVAGSSYIKIPKKLDHPRNFLINIQNTAHNECFK